MAAADYAEGRTDEPPPMVRVALQYGQVSQDAWLELPAKVALKVRQIFFAYTSMQGYVDAGRQGHTVAWTERNPRHWDQVTRIIKARREHGE